MPISREAITAQREHKIRSAMGHWAPLWLINDQYRPREESLVFSLAYQHPVYGWVKHHFKYDGFNDVLYHMGEACLNEDSALTIQEQEPFISGDVSLRVPNAPAARQSPPLKTGSVAR
jgi:hypothetical protein